VTVSYNLTDPVDRFEYSVNPFTSHRIRCLPDEQLEISLDHKEWIVDLMGHCGREAGDKPKSCACSRHLLELRVPDGDGGLGRERAYQLLVVRIKGDDLVASVERIDQLEDADDVACGRAFLDDCSPTSNPSATSVVRKAGCPARRSPEIERLTQKTRALRNAVSAERQKH
jgi:hypothetical protein